MKKKKEIVSEVTSSKDVIIPAKITPLTQEFGNGDLNTLRDKINELIARG